jgi:hypothetical protein
MSSIVDTTSGLGTVDPGFSTLAARLVRASVALLEMVSVLSSGTLPILRLRSSMDFSASFTASLNFERSGSSC